MTDIYDLSNKRLFTTQPTLNNYVTIASVVSAQIPLANVFNGQSYLVDIVKNMTANAATNPQSISFTAIQKVLDFKMYRSVKPKVIFSAYVSRVLPDNTNNIGTQTYSPVVQFKIDYDAACIGSMMALFTVDIGVRSTLSTINVNGLSANGSANGVSVSMDDVYSIQYAYCTDFAYHYVDKVSIGFANTGGNAPIWHQEIPSEIIKIYHTMLSTPGMNATIKRALREDQFTIGHQCYGQFGDFSFAVKSPATLPSNTTYSALGKAPVKMNIMQQTPAEYSGYNELAVYWNDTQIKEVSFGTITNTGYNPANSYQLTFKDPKNSGSTFTEQTATTASGAKVIKQLELDTELYWKLGTVNSALKLSYNTAATEDTTSQVITADFSDGKKYMRIVSDESYLTSDYGNYPQVQLNGETVYLIPFIKYGTVDAEFDIALVHPASVYPYDNKLYTTAEHTLESIFNTGNALTFALIDSNTVDGITTDYTSQIVFTLSALSASFASEIKTPVFISRNKLTINNEQYELVSATTGEMFGTTKKDAEQTESWQRVDAVTTTSSIEKALISQTSTQDRVISLSQLVNTTIAEMGTYVLQSTGALSPIMQQANIGYMNVDIKPYDQNDLSLSSLTIYTQSNGKTLIPSGSDAYAIFRYNAAIASMGSNEEKHPNLINLDQQSIHTFRKDHGIVDFYFPLQFLFICQDISQSFPHYACAAQSILIKFEFNNPLSFMNTSISINPRAMDSADYGKKERLLINRVLPSSVLQTQLNNMRYVLFYTRYAWVPNLMPIVTQYRFYSWIIKNYERIYTPITNVSGSQTYTLATFNKSNFYTRIWTFLVTKETLDLVASRGQAQDYIPICPNRFYLNQFDVLRFGSNLTSGVGANLTGSDASDYLAQQNSVYFQTPVDSFQLKTSTSINMTDEMPSRAQLLYPYLLLEHQAIESSMDFNNLFQFNIDPVFYSEGFPYLMYSPAFAPDFKLECTTKSGSGQPDFGAIVIPEYENVSYISQHVMLLKYSTTN